MELLSDLFVRINLDLKTSRNILNFILRCKTPFETFGVLHNGSLEKDVLDKILCRKREHIIYRLKNRREHTRNDEITIRPHKFLGTLRNDIFCSVGSHVQHFEFFVPHHHTHVCILWPFIELLTYNRVFSFIFIVGPRTSYSLLIRTGRLKSTW
jgi:hypothetical protein